MSATDDLRSLLDERGAKWKADTSVINGVVWTIWKSPWFGETWAKEVDGSISLFNCSMTPEQAIEATLGRGECHDMYEDDGYFKCSECGGRMHGWTEDDSAIWFSTPHFCPNCGKKVRA